MSSDFDPRQSGCGACDTPTACRRDGRCNAKAAPTNPLDGGVYFGRPTTEDMACLRRFDPPKSKAQEWADAESAREAERRTLHAKLMSLRQDKDAPQFEISRPHREGDTGYIRPLLAAQVSREGGLHLDSHGDDPLPAADAIRLARWILETFEVPK